MSSILVGPERWTNLDLGGHASLLGPTVIRVVETTCKIYRSFTDSWSMSQGSSHPNVDSLCSIVAEYIGRFS